MHCGHDHSAPVRDPIFGGSSYEASMLRGLLGTILGEGYVAQHGLDKAIDAAQACLSRAEAPAIEPVAWIDEFGNVFPLAAWVKSEVKAKWRPLYTHPAPDQEAAELLELNRTLADINANLMARLADQEARPAQEAAEPENEWTPKDPEARFWRDRVNECAPYLKDGETPLQRIERDHRDTMALMRLLAAEKIKNEALMSANTGQAATINAPTQEAATAERVACPQCGATMLYDDGEPWEGPKWGCPECGHSENAR